MKIRFSWIILLLTLFVPFEVLILKYLPVSDTVYSFLRFAVEIIIYVLGGTLLLRFVYLKKLPTGTPVDKPILIFIGYAILITITNGAPMLQSLMGLRTLLRYIPLFYVLAFIRPDQKMVKMIFFSIIFISGIQGIITGYQHFFGLSDFWYPRASDLEIGGKQVNFRVLASGFGGGREMGAGIGTFGDSVFLALFMVVAFTLVFSSLQKSPQLGKNLRWIIGVISIMIIASLFFSYSRGSVFVALGTIPIILYISGRKKKLAIYLIAGLILIAPLLFISMLGDAPSGDAYVNPKLKYTDPFSNITTVFSSSYVDNTMQFSRGLVLTEIGGNLLTSFKLTGYSPAQDFALEKAATKLFGSNMPINNLPVINDVYWVAFVIYYGLIGLVIYFFILYKIFRASLFVYKNSNDTYYRIFALAMAALVIASVPYSFILRTFVFRSFGFFFWLMAGLVFSEWRRLKSEQTLTTD